MDVDAVLAELEGRQPERMVPDVSRISALAELMDHPELAYPTVHVTGTNGKTTTALLVARLACEHGLVAGAFISPHLVSVTERLSVCGEPIADDDLAEEYERLLPYLRTVDARGGERVTYFEALTALAYLWFADRPVALGVFEVGMGGTWDATNLVAGDVAVLCPIALDHPELGSTVAEVATEKAGIVKPGKAAVVREQPPEALAVIEDRCREYEADLLLEGRDWTVDVRRPGIGGQVVTVRGRHAAYEDLLLPLFGEHAARNAGASVVALEALLGRALSEPAVRRALEGAAVPGRLEVARRRPLVVLDGAHNPAAAMALAGTLPEAFAWDRLLLVLGVSANKDVPGVVGPLAALADRAFVAPHSRAARTAPPEVVARACEEAGLTADSFGSVGEAVDAALAEAGQGDLLLVTGSLYTVADARTHLLD
ncbi:MAG: dihydrofolate synthase [Actinobacteria bacterium]|nr:dihydrofolate synthase [Actinomycetota bacterium]